MRVVLDTNILLSALMARGTPPDRIYAYWKDGRFELLACERQLEEIRRVSRRPYFRDRLKPSEVGRLVNDIRRLAHMSEPARSVSRSPDPNDDFLLALAETASADFIVTGDKSDLLALRTHAATRIVTARLFVDLLGH
jgi:uncharacterized protein